MTALGRAHQDFHQNLVRHGVSRSSICTTRTRVICGNGSVRNSTCPTLTPQTFWGSRGRGFESRQPDQKGQLRRLCIRRWRRFAMDPANTNVFAHALPRVARNLRAPERACSAGAGLL